MVHIAKAMVFSAVMFGCDSWTIKKAEHQRIDAFKLVLEKIPESPLDSRESKPVNLKRNQPQILVGRTDAEAEVQYLCHLMRIADSLEKSLMLLKIEGRRRRGHQKMRWLDSITNAINMNLGKFQEMKRNREAWCAAVHGTAKSLPDWATEQQCCEYWFFFFSHSCPF